MDMIGQFSGDVVGRLSVKPCMLLAIKTRDWCVSIRLLSQLKSRLLSVKLSVVQCKVLGKKKQTGKLRNNRKRRQQTKKTKIEYFKPV